VEDQKAQAVLSDKIRLISALPLLTNIVQPDILPLNSKSFTSNHNDGQDVEAKPCHQIKDRDAVAAAIIFPRTGPIASHYGACRNFWSSQVTDDHPSESIHSLRWCGD
jgi:hypothetical protein